MADCELCGAMKVGTRAVIMGRAEVQACKRCTEKMGLAEKKVAPGLAKARSTTTPTSGGYGGIGRKGKDIMLRARKNSHRTLQNESLLLARNVVGTNVN